MKNKFELNENNSITKNGYVLNIEFQQWTLEDIDALLDDYYLKNYLKNSNIIKKSTDYESAFHAMEVEAQNLLQELSAIPSFSRIKTLSDILNLADSVRSSNINPSLYSLTYSDEVNDDGDRDVCWGSVTTDKYPLLSIISTFELFRWEYIDQTRTKSGAALEKLKKDLASEKEKHSKLEKDLKDCADKKFVDKKLNPSITKIQKLEEDLNNFKELPDFPSWLKSIFKENSQYEKALDLLFKMGKPNII